MRRTYSTPIDALAAAITAGFVSSVERRPGAVISRLPKEMRERLERLTSDQARSMRADGLRLDPRIK